MSIVNSVNKETHEVSFEPSVALYFINSLKYRPMKKFRNTNASVVDWHTPKGFHFIDPYNEDIIEFCVSALKSYNTMVCAYITVVYSDNTFHAYGLQWIGYSRSTDDQIRKFVANIDKDLPSHAIKETFTFKVSHI